MIAGKWRRVETGVRLREAVTASGREEELQGGHERGLRGLRQRNVFLRNM